MPFVTVWPDRYTVLFYCSGILQRCDQQHPAVHADAFDPGTVNVPGAQPGLGRFRYLFSLFLCDHHSSTSFLGTNGAIRQVSFVVPVEITFPEVVV